MEKYTLYNSMNPKQRKYSEVSIKLSSWSDKERREMEKKTNNNPEFSPKNRD